MQTLRRAPASVTHMQEPLALQPAATNDVSHDATFDAYPFRCDPTHPFHNARYVVVPELLMDLFFDGCCFRLPGCVDSIVMNTVITVMSFMVWWLDLLLELARGIAVVLGCTRMRTARFMYGWRGFGWAAQFERERTAIWRREGPALKQRLNTLTRANSSHLPLAVAQDLSRLSKAFKWSFLNWKPAKWERQVRYGKTAALSQIWTWAAIVLVLPFVYGFGTYWDRYMVVITLIAVARTWMASREGSKLGAIADVLDDGRSVLRHAWVPPRVHTPSEKAAARAALRAMATQYQQAVKDLDERMQNLKLLGILGTIGNYIVIDDVESVAIRHIALVLVSAYFMSSLVARSEQEGILRLQLAYHVVELREVLLEHAESIATPPQAWPDAPAAQRQPGVEDTPSYA